MTRMDDLPLYSFEIALPPATAAGFTGFPASAIWSAIMATVIIAGWELNRSSDLINSLFTAALIILAWDPHWIRDRILSKLAPDRITPAMAAMPAPVAHPRKKRR